MLTQRSKYQKNGPGWYSKEVVELEIHTKEYKPVRGSSYIPLPDFIANMTAIINIKNNNEKCFLWSMLRYLHPRETKNRRLTDLKQYEDELDFNGIDFPVKLKDVKRFENRNSVLPGDDVFPINDKNDFYPLRMAEKDCQKTTDLFLFEKDGKHHYSLIEHFNRLFRFQIISQTNAPVYICKECFTIFTKKELFDKQAILPQK